MDSRQWKRTISYGLIAGVLFLLLGAATFRSRADCQERQQFQVVLLGDSIFGLPRDETAISDKLEGLLGKTVFNGAFGGSCISRVDGEFRMTYAYDSLSLVGITKAIATDDFGVQQTVRIRQSGTEHFADTVDTLEQIDFSAVELVVVMHGLNDFYSGVPIYNEEDPLDEYSFIGALRSSLMALRQANPDMRILLVTPTYTWRLDSGITCEEYNAGYGVEEDYVLAEIELAQDMGVEIIDAYHDLYPHERWEDWQQYSADGLHPNEEGRELIAKLIFEYLQENP